MTERKRFLAAVLIWEAIVVLLAIVASECRLSSGINLLDRRVFGTEEVYTYRNMILPKVVAWLIYSIPASLAGLFTYRKLQQNASETRCRRCGYILRGLDVPRCSECGERI